MKLLPKEIWNDIPGFKNYQAGSLGNIRSIGFIGDIRYKNITIRNGRVLKPWIGASGYRQVNLCVGGIVKTKKVARLVSLAFLPNPHNLPEVNHKNECITDDSVGNLEWCTRDYNLHYGTRCQRIGKACAKMVAQYTLDGKLVYVWESLHEIERRLNYQYQNIWKCCVGRRDKAHGYQWKYYEPNLNKQTR